MKSILAHLIASSRGLANATPLDVTIVDGNGNPITSFGGSGGTSAADESAFTVGSGQGTPAMGIFETSPSTLTNGQVGLIGLTNDRKVKVSGSFSATPATSTVSALSNVADNVASVTVLASNAARLAFILWNDSTSVVYVKLGATASATSFVHKMLPEEKWTTMDLGINYTGKIDAIWATAPGGAMRVTELTA